MGFTTWRISLKDFDPNLQDTMNQMTNIMSSSMDMTELVSYNIFGAAVTTTRAFEKISLKIDSNGSRVYVTIRLRWWAKYKKFEMLRDAWLRRAESRCTEHLPAGWKILCYYTKD